jgi:hypothetical protein
MDAVIQEMIREYGPGEIPVVDPIDLPEKPEGASPVADTSPAPPPEPSQVTVNGVSLTGKLRAEAMTNEAIAEGFRLRSTMYSVGTVVEGQERVLQMQLAHEARPLARDVAASLVSRVKQEERKDIPVALLKSDIRMDDNGHVRLANDTSFIPSDHALDGFFQRFPCSGGGTYARSCPNILKAINFNYWVIAEKEDKPKQVVLRTRKVLQSPGLHEVFAVVSPSYTAFDADKIGQALVLSFPEDARGVLQYDGYKFRVEGLWHSDVAPNEFVVGEIFKAGVLVSSDDSGAGSIRVRSVIWRNLCKNLLILDKSIGVDIRLRHLGDVEKLAKAFEEAFDRALQSVEPFRKAWGSAMAERDESLLQMVQGTTTEDITGKKASEVLPGIFYGVLQREMVPVRGKKKDVVKLLVEMHEQDELAAEYGYSRASIVNAFTRYSHIVESDPFAADEIREGAGSLLRMRGEKFAQTIPYEKFDL